MADSGQGLLTLRNGKHRVEVFDPRTDPRALGARYVHGCYVAAWYVGERCLTGRPKQEWNPYEGQGLPETFEYGLGWGAAEEGEEFLRIGAGRLKRAGRNWPQAGGEPSGTVAWTVSEHTQDSLIMRCRDEATIGRLGYGYELERQVRVHPDGVEGRTQLRISCPWSHPVFWFAHPFFSHCDGTGTALRVPSGAVCAGSLQTTADRNRTITPSEGGFGPVTGVWGCGDPLELELDSRLGGGVVRIEVTRPLDKLVVFSTPRVFSVEPYLARAWHDGETAGWAIRYRFRP